MRTLRRIVVVGGGVAGLRTAEALRHNGFTGELIGLTSEPHPPYARPPLSKAALSDPDWRLQPLDETTGVSWRLGTTASGLDLTNRRIEIGDGTDVAFDAAVLATGLSGRIPPTMRAALPLRTADDAIRLRAILHGHQGNPGRHRNHRHLVIVGAGFIGSEVAVAARQAGWTVTVADPQHSPLAPALGTRAAQWLWEQHRVRGVRTRFSHAVHSIERTDDGYHVVLDDGSVVPADAVVAGLGATPNTEWLSGSGLDITDGVLTDAGGTVVTTDGTVVDDVVAVGDVARTPSPLTGGRAVRHEHWAAATSGAQRVSATLTGHRPPPAIPPVFWTDVYEHRVQVTGRPEGTESEPEPGPRGFCVRYRSGDGTLTGAVAVNWPQRLAVLTRELATAGRAA
ncbi:FAD-dependent oxidoreductase [Saccharomonospora xinjiangensis]|uniref:NAD(P)/FAD-dependent oxidoreductase n=1 Tax=Saccharomonospora xinjiangensis TaxID=75294 RepID=UPI001070083D|nr:FAD-dependent oxidoreductase [Saccharomonospora xinjiangensis]QBQ60313.1 Rhodocoxin reductase [Saccharomonospora xinjiangensis]